MHSIQGHMDKSKLAKTRDDLVRKYREIPFATWARISVESGRFNDYAEGDIEHPDWWQAHTAVLEIVKDNDGPMWANVSIVLYPRCVHSLPPALAASLTVYDNRTVEGLWSNGDEFKFVQAQHDS